MQKKVRLDPDCRTLGGIALGSAGAGLLSSGLFQLDGRDEDGMAYLESNDMALSVSTVDDIVVSVCAFEECYWNDVDLIGLQLEQVESQLGELSLTESGEVNMYRSAREVDVWMRNGRVIQVQLSDYGLVAE
jgi:hypothetical protein